MNLNNTWQKALTPYLTSESGKQLKTAVDHLYQTESVFPPQTTLFQALNLTPYGTVKVCILGQDPYHGVGQANGLAFSVNRGVSLPPSLRNIYQELENDLGIPPAEHGDLTSWAEQGVLLLNTVLTVREGEANSHHHIGWQSFTDEIIRLINIQEQPIVFILWGKKAQEKFQLIDNQRHGAINSPHPSPLSAYRGFFGSKPFSQTNNYLQQWGREAIDWQLP